MDPAWVTTVIAIAGVIVSGLSAFYGTKIAVARLEVQQANTAKDVEDHEDRLRALERGPFDYVSR